MSVDCILHYNLASESDTRPLMCFPVRRLLDQGISADTCTEDGLTALHQVSFALNKKAIYGM